MKNLSTLIVLFILFNSCETALDIELPSIESKLVVNSYLITDEYWDTQNQFLLLSNSIEGMGSLNDYTYTDSFPVISYANAFINELNTIDNDIINTYPLDFTTNCYCYTNPSFTPKENTTYELHVEASGYPNIFSTERMPSKPKYTISDFEMKSSIDQKEEEGELCEFKILLEDPPNQTNYYRLKIILANNFNDRGTPCTYQVVDPSFLIPINRYNSSNTYFEGKNGYFTDELFNGENKQFFIEVEKPKGSYDHFYIEVVSYSENLYNFNLTRKEQRRDSNNFLFNSEAIFIDSNIEGGYGVFGGRARSRRAYIPTYYPANGWIEY
ncbi:MAG: hypothetical protein CMP50_04280 [Flavobacteriales bacterium]|nr:hypothetical protein [Flavobacteriales bacterium]